LLGYQLLSESKNEINTFMHSDKTMLQIFKYNHEDKTYLCYENFCIQHIIFNMLFRHVMAIK